MAKVEDCCDECAPIEMDECLEKMLTIAREAGVHACVVGLVFDGGEPEDFHVLLGFGECLKHQLIVTRDLGKSLRAKKAEADAETKAERALARAAKAAKAQV